MQKSKIEWLRSEDGKPGYSWNPIKGICPVGCWYCYARRIYQRFKLDPKPWLDIAELNELVETRRTGKRVFVCSTFELFHPAADGKMRNYIIDAIGRRPDLTFIILTKMPERIDRPMPENVWLGVTVEGAAEWHRAKHLITHGSSKIKFVSFEPLTGLPEQSDFRHVAGELDWIIIGRLTGHGHKHDPLPETLRAMMQIAKDFGAPLFMKNNLKEIWDGPLIQEFPEVPNA